MNHLTQASGAGPWRIWALSLVCAQAIWVQGVHAQATATPSSSSASSGKVIGLQTGGTSSGSDALAPSTAVVGPRLDLQAVPSEVKAQLERFQTARDAYLKRQQDLTQQLKGATDAQRKLLREQLQVLRREWLEKSIQFRRELTDHLPPDVLHFEALRNKPAPVDTPSKRDRRLN